jgi:transposase
LLQERWQAAYAAGDLPVVRRTAVLLELAHGMAVAAVAEAYAITRETVYEWLKAFLVDGLASLGYGKAPGRPARLTPPQQQKLRALVKAGPLAAGYLTACWTALLVQQLIQREFGVLYNRHYVCALLRNLGFSFQKARFVSDHLDPEARRQWLETTWAQILQLRQEKNALLLFGDEVSFAQWGSLGYTWALQGETPVVQTSGRRKGYKVFGVIDFLAGHFFYQATTERFNAETYQAFLQTVLEQTTQHLILVQDGARYHTGQATRAFFATHAERLTVFQLPSYSPDYNPIEFLWRNIKRQATHNQYFPEFTDLMTAVDRALADMAAQPMAIKALRGPYVESLEALAA